MADNLKVASDTQNAAREMLENLCKQITALPGMAEKAQAFFESRLPWLHDEKSEKQNPKLSREETRQYWAAVKDFVTENYPPHLKDQVEAMQNLFENVKEIAMRELVGPTGETKPVTVSSKKPDRWISLTDLQVAFKEGGKAENIVRAALNELPDDEALAKVYRAARNQQTGDMLYEDVKQNFIVDLVGQGKLTQRYASGQWSERFMINAGTADKLQK